NSATAFRYATKSDSIINLKWWEIFNDSTLDTLIVTALRENKNLLIAASRIEQARANVSFNKADYGPKFSVTGNAGRGNTVQGLRLNQPTSSFGTSAVVDWEIDFWGKYKRSTEAAKSDLLASFYGKRALEIALISEVATNYFLLLDFRARLEISEYTLALRDSTLSIIQARFDKGYTNVIDVNQAQIQKAITQVSIPQFKRQIAFTEHNLSVLLGRMPDAIITDMNLTEYSLPDSIPNGIPSEILQRRPDVLQANQYYKSQNAKIGVAQAMRFPSISLTGLLGLGSNELSNLVSDGLGWSAGGALAAPLFEWGKNKKRVDIERAKAVQSLYGYENTVLNAFLEVDNSLIELSTLREELVANEAKLKAASNASYLSHERYYEGITSYLEVIENQGQEFDAKLSYSENYQRLLTSYIKLYKSLGGGWISKEEQDKYAQQLADDQGVDVSDIDVDSLYYSGQVVDLVLSKEEKKARKEAAKELRKKERADKKENK
ncbi:MAG: efflux transporter outer membrane subunit, partial [Flavobacteriaceae bacterium]|nr:efflux transporter outer membrane subunit [Flavobacteriaceae bacterium]